MPSMVVFPNTTQLIIRSTQAGSLLTVLLTLIACGAPNTWSKLNQRSSASKRGLWLQALENTSDSNQKQQLEMYREACSGDSVHLINDMPLDHDQQGSPTFPYSYEWIPADPDQPTVIFLTGGPGGGAISKRFLPKKFGVVNVDPRGVRCNYGSEYLLPSEVLTTRQTALDIVRLIADLNLDNYVIYGASYGTILGTILTYEIQKTDLPRPQLLLFEGTFGRALESSEQYTQSHLRQLRHFFNQNPNLQAMFLEEKLPLTNSPIAWGSFLYEIGNIYEMAAERLTDLKHEIDQGYEGPAHDFFRAFLEVSGTPSYFAGLSQRVRRQIVCRELSRSWESDRRYPVWQNGQMNFQLLENAPNKPLCAGMQHDLPYDSRHYQLEVPIYYLQGELDPQTPMSDALYHHDNQVLAPKKVWWQIPQGGHSTFYQEELFGWKSCHEKIWQRILALRPLDGLVDGIHCQ